MATLAVALRSVNDQLPRLLPEQSILAAAAAVNHRWRRRQLGPVETVVLLVVQILCANASLARLRAINGYRTSVSALAQARARLPIALLQRLFDWLLEQHLPRGPRVLRIDCCNSYLQDTRQLRCKYRHPRQKRRRCDYPQIRSICVFDVNSGLLIAERDFSSDRQESPQLKHLLPLLRSSDIVIFDRGFVSYANLCLLRAADVQVISRLPKTLLARQGTRRIKRVRLDKRDHLVRWSKPAQRTSGLGKKQWEHLPDTLELRQISFCGVAGHSRCRRIHLITTLSDGQTHTARQIGDWYRRRWEIETDFRHLKQTLGLEMLRSKSSDNVRRELLVRAIAYNLVRVVMLKAAALKRIPCDRISFADACRWLFLPCGEVPLSKLLSNPRRTRRTRPRKVKYRGKNYRQLNHRASQRQR